MRQKQKNIFWLGLVSFFNDTASKIILPILPLFLKEIGATGLAIGLISGLGESIASLFKMLAGYWSDKIGKRKIFVFWGYLIAAFAKLSFTLVNVWPQALGAKSLERLGKGLRSAPRDALLSASSSQKKRGKSFGIHRAMDSGGAVLGSVGAFLLFWYLHLSFRTIFLIAGIIAFFSLLPLILVKETKTELTSSRTLKLSVKKLSLRLRFFILIASLFALANFSYMFFVLKSQFYFQQKFAIGIPILLYALYNFSYSTLAIPFGSLSDKIGRARVLLTGYALFVLICLGFIVSHSLGFFIILFILLGADYALVNANQRAFIADLAPVEERGTALGVFYMATSLVVLPAGLLVGFLWDISPTAPFLYGSIVAALAAMSFFIFYRYYARIKS